MRRVPFGPQAQGGACVPQACSALQHQKRDHSESMKLRNLSLRLGCFNLRKALASI